MSSVQAEDGAGPTLGEIRLEDVQENNGAYTIPRAELPARVVAEDEATFLLSPMTVTGIRLPAEDDPAPDAAVKIDGFSLHSVRGTVEEGEILLLEDIQASGLAFAEDEISEPRIFHRPFLRQHPDRRRGRGFGGRQGHAPADGRSRLFPYRGTSSTASGRYDPSTAVASFEQTIVVDDAAALRSVRGCRGWSRK